MGALTVNAPPLALPRKSLIRCTSNPPGLLSPPSMPFFHKQPSTQFGIDNSPSSGGGTISLLEIQVSCTSPSLRSSRNCSSSQQSGKLRRRQLSTIFGGGQSHPQEENYATAGRRFSASGAGAVEDAHYGEAPLALDPEPGVASRREEPSGATDVHVGSNGNGSAVTSTLALGRKLITGGALDFRPVTTPLISKPLVGTKKIVLVRHGLSSWNSEGRIQGSSDMSVLSDKGIEQAERCKQSLAKLKFSSCFASPISRARTSAEVIWSGREEPLVYLDILKEAHLLFFEGMRNVDARAQYPELYRTWRENPMKFNVDGMYPVVKLWDQAKDAWQAILSGEGEITLVVTHKSILRALICTALGMGPDKFRAIDINNGGISTFTVSEKGEPLLQCLNMTAHLHVDGVFY